MNRRVSHLIAGWRTGLPRPVLILQAGNAINYFGYGLIVPFEIIYLHLSLPFNHPVFPEEPRAVGGRTHRSVAKDL
jgi:hypothetical protein